MPDRAPEGTIVHVDLVTGDATATRHFLEAAFGWKVQPLPSADHALFQAPSPPHGGIRDREEGEPAGARAYIAVDSLADARDRIVKAGGVIVGAQQDVPGFGRFVLFEAPGGLVLGAFEES